MRIQLGVFCAGIFLCAAVGAQEPPPGFKALGKRVPDFADRLKIPRGWKDVTPSAPDMPPLTELERAAGYVLFSRNPMSEPQVRGVPFRFEIDRQIITFAALGQYEPVLLCVRPIEDLEDAVLTVGGLVGPGGRLLSAQNIDVRQVWIQRRAEDRAAQTYRLVPCVLEAAHPTAMAKGLTRHYWVTLFAPKDAVPGIYRGTATFRAKGRAPAVREIAFRVLPFELDSAGESGVKESWICDAASFTDAHFNRMRFGWYLLRVGGAGASDWADHWPGPQGAYDDLSGGSLGAHNAFVYPSPEGPVPTVAWEGYCAAADDVRYVRTLERLCREQQEQKPDEVATARQEMADMIGRFFPNERDTVTVVSPDTAQIWRGRLAWHILNLMDAEKQLER
jgi:hypothetical protein